MPHSPPPPIQIGYPRHAYGSGYLTDGRPSPTELEPNTDAGVAQVVGQGALVESNIQLTPIPTGQNTCYRDVVLTGLFALKPFVGYIEQAASVPDSEHDDTVQDFERATVLKHLQPLQQEFWRATDNFGPKRVTLSRLATAFHTAFANFGDSDPTAQDDAPLFMQALLQKLDPGYPIQSDLADAFPLIFWSQFVPRNAYECQCTKKSREGAHRLMDDRLICPININENNRTIGDAFAWSMYDRQGENENTCAICGKKAKQHRFLKYRYLPEILILQVEYSKVGKTGYPERDAQARCALPEQLDLGALHDKIVQPHGYGLDEGESRPRPQQDQLNVRGKVVKVAHDTQYQLQFVIDYSGKGSAGHYRCNVRDQKDQWILLDGLGRRSVAKKTSLAEVESDKAFQPRMIAYVRKHDGSAVEPAIAEATQENLTGQPLGPGLSVDQRKVQDSNLSAAKDSNQSQPRAQSESLAAAQAGYDEWNNKQLRDEIGRRGLVLPTKKDNQSLRDLLQKQDHNPNDYSLMTAKHLNEEVKRRNLFPAGKKTLVKLDLIKILGHNIGGSVPSVPNTSTQQQRPPIDEAVATVGRDNLENLQRQLETQRLALIKEKDDLTDHYYAAFRKMFARAQAEETRLKSQLQDADARANQAEAAVEKLKRQSALNQSTIASGPHRSPQDQMLSVLLHVNVPSTVARTGCEVHGQYLILMANQLVHDYGSATVTVTALQDTTDATMLLVRAVVTIPAWDDGVAPLTQTIHIQLPEQTDKDGLRMSAETSIVAVSSPVCIQLWNRAAEPVSQADDTNVSQKRSHSEAGHDDVSSQGENPSKRQKL